MQADLSEAKRFEYRNGTDGTAVSLIAISSGGHTEPSVKERYGLVFKAIVGRQNGDIATADEVWRFFQSVTPK